jgi:hypothetical protein
METRFRAKSARDTLTAALDDLPYHQADAIRDLLATLDAAVAELAACHNATGADPDGDEDWRLAHRALAEVQSMRKERDNQLVGHTFALLGALTAGRENALVGVKSSPYEALRDMGFDTNSTSRETRSLISMFVHGWSKP